MSSDSKMDNLQNTLTQGFLPGLDATNDSVGLTVFPPDTNGTRDVCNAQSSSSVRRGQPNLFGGAALQRLPVLVGRLEQQLDAGQGHQLPAARRRHRLRGSALEAAYAQLQANGRAGVQKVIVLLSDGAANDGPNCADVTTTTTTGSGKHKQTVTTTTKDQDPKCLTPCHAAISDATTYKNSKVLVYTILYGDQSDAPYCLDYSNKDREVPNITPQSTMQQIAGTNTVTGQLDYWADPDPADLNGVFQEIAADMAAGTSRITS